MAALNGVASAPSTGWVANGKRWKRPRDGREFVGFLAGARRDTREAFAKILWERYGIRIAKHIGYEHRKEVNSLFVPSNTEVCVIIGDDIEDPQLNKLLACIKVVGCDNIGIEYAKRRNPAAWDPAFVGNGYSSPPKWRDGALIEPPDLKKFEEERLKELAAIEETRPAYVDSGAAKVVNKLDVSAVLEKYKPKPEEPKPAPAPAKASSRGPNRDHQPAAAPERVAARKAWGEELLGRRKALGISQGEAARRCKFPDQTMLSAYERGDAVPLYPFYLKLLSIFPGLSEPTGMKGKKAFEKRGGMIKPRGKDELVPVFAAPAQPPPPVVVETPPPPPPAPVAAPVVVAAPVAAPVPTGAQEELVTIKLRSGGTLTVSASVNMFKLRGEDRAFIFDIIDKLQAYEEGVKNG